MIEERARVLAAGAGFAWVETQRRSTCDGCAASSGCGTSAISKVVGRKRARVRAVDPIGAAVGDEVIIAIEESALLRGSSAVYLIPLLLMLAFAVLGQQWGSATGLSADATAAILGLLGLAIGFGWLAWFARSVRDDARYQPVILRPAARVVGHN